MHKTDFSYNGEKKFCIFLDPFALALTLAAFKIE